MNNTKIKTEILVTHFNISVITLIVSIVNQSIHLTNILYLSHSISIYVNDQNIVQNLYDIIIHTIYSSIVPSYRWNLLPPRTLTHRAYMAT